MTTINADYVTTAGQLEDEEFNLDVTFMHDLREVTGELVDVAECAGKTVVALYHGHNCRTVHYILDMDAHVGVFLP
ncbi:hypothetical protein NTR1_15 [Nocardia phage NTR1]|nr:hypothetical protein NTR1_15 [Nocardia phage NTR1]